MDNPICCNKEMKLVGATWFCRESQDCSPKFDYAIHHENIKRDRGARQPKKRYRSVRGLNKC